MSKNDIKKIAKRAIKTVEANQAEPTRGKTSIYINTDIWKTFKENTKKQRGLSSELLEQFMIEYNASVEKN
jgi:hypothetical protein